jgi:uncharacterized Zn-finger protein
MPESTEEKVTITKKEYEELSARTVDARYLRFPTCPYCGYEDIDWEDERVFLISGDTAKITCDSCKKKYLCTTTIMQSFRSCKTPE